MKKEFPLAMASRLSTAYYEMTWMNLAANFYDFYEGCQCGAIALDQVGAEATKQFLEVLANVISEKDYSEEEQNAMIDALLELRKVITERVETITYYTDRLSIYEYLMNRAEYSFKDNIEATDDEEEARKLLQFIFNSEDNAVVNMRIRDMVSQLPIRMTKGHFYDLVNGSLGIYEGTDEESFSGYLYMLLSAAGLGKKQGTFTENAAYEEVLTKLSAYDFSILSKEQFEEMDALVADATAKITVEAESFLPLQSLVNFLLAILLVEKEGYKTSESRTQMLPIISEVAEHFTGYLETEDEPSVSEETVSRFIYLEGRLEKIAQQVLRDEGKLDEYLAEEEEPADEIIRLGMAKKLIGTSKFVSFEEADKTIVDSKRIEAARKDMSAAFEEAFAGKDRRYMRAVMAQVLKELPVFFNSHNEVMNYVLQALQGCRDQAEKRASLDMVWQLLD